MTEFMNIENLYADIQLQADTRNEEVLVLVLKNTSIPEPLFDFVGIELACEYASAGSGRRKDRLRRILMEHFADRFNLDERFGFEKTGL